MYEVIDATAFPSPRHPFSPIHWSWHHQCREDYPPLFTDVLHSLRQPSILACVSDVSPYDPFRPHSPLGWFVKHFPAHHDIIGRTLPRSDQFYSSVSRPRLLLAQSSVTRIPVDKSLTNLKWGFIGEPRLIRMAHEMACTRHAHRLLLI